MAEPVPLSSQKAPKAKIKATENNESAIDAADSEVVPENLPSNAEDRAAAVALSALKTSGTEVSASDADAAGQAGARLPSAADQEALGQAMSRLELIAGAGKGQIGAAKKKDAKKDASSTGTAGVSSKGTELDEKEGAVKKKVPVKLSADDVALLVNHLDLTKVRATELLKAHEGDPTKAIKAFLGPASATSSIA